MTPRLLNTCPVSQTRRLEGTLLVLTAAWAPGNVFRFADWNVKETEFLNQHPLITAKPVVYLLNLSEKNFISKKSKFQKPVFEWVQVRSQPALMAQPRVAGCCPWGADLLAAPA